MEWEKLFKRYVWNDQTTPYLTSVKKLTQRQANSEVFIYSLFIGIFFIVACIAAIRNGANTASAGIALYSFSTVCAAVIFCYLKSYYASLYLSAAPLTIIAYIFISNHVISSHSFDTLIVVVILLLVLRYSFRIIAISQYYHTYKENGDDAKKL